MSFLKLIAAPALLLIATGANAQAAVDLRAAHDHLIDLDLADYTLADIPDWQVPAAMAAEGDGSVFVQRSLGRLDGGYTLAAFYAWRNGGWEAAGWRLAHPGIASEWDGERVFREADELPGEQFARDPGSVSAPGLMSQNFCTDSPDSRGPDGTFGHTVGDRASFAWDNHAQGCAYETDYEMQVLPGGSIGWVVIDFRFEFRSDDDDDSGDDENDSY